MQELSNKLETKIQEQNQEKKNMETQHREIVMDLNGKINEKDQSLS